MGKKKNCDCNGIISGSNFECMPDIFNNKPIKLRVRGTKAYFVYDNDLELYQGEIISQTDTEILVENQNEILKITVA